MYAHVCCATGWTWEYVGQWLTLPRLNALLMHWQRVPPVAESVARYLGIGKPEVVVRAPPKPVSDLTDEIRSMQRVPPPWLTTTPK